MRMHLRLSFILCISLILLIGCQSNANDQSKQTKKHDNQRVTHVKQNQQDEDIYSSHKQMANHLANVANDVPQVNDAVAVVAGPYAVVGIDVDKDLDRTRVGSIKYSVAEALHHDPYGKTAVVVADADMLERLQSMRKKIQEGYPIQGVVDELANIVGRYIPDLPIPDDQPQDPDQNKDVIPKKDQDKLDDIEEEQSDEKNVQ